MALLRKFFNQTRKPEGFLGKLMLSGMNSGHAKLADWGFEHLPELTVSQAVDLGCGGGRNAGELLKKYPAAHVTAIDYSALCVEKAKAYNRAMIAAGRCEVRGEMLCRGGEGVKARRGFSDLQRVRRNRSHRHEIRVDHRGHEKLHSPGNRSCVKGCGILPSGDRPSPQQALDRGAGEKVRASVSRFTKQTTWGWRAISGPGRRIEHDQKRSDPKRL